jgi:drug/metabolite transporter (DMT)-like permease
MWIGTLFALAAGLMWGLVFVGPLWLHDYPAVLLSFGRYLAFGLIALPLGWLDRAELRRLRRADWLEAAKLSLVGNIVYYLFLASALQRAGGPLPTMIIGTLPVVIAVVSNRRNARRDGLLPWRRLAPSLVLIGAGLLLVNRAELAHSGPTRRPTWAAMSWGRAGPGRRGGLDLVPGAQRRLAARPRRPQPARLGHRPGSGHPAAGGAGLCPDLGMVRPRPAGLADAAGPRPLPFVGAMLAIGLLASWLGTLCWNEASQRLPTALAGQLIVFETLSALAYAYALRQQFPPSATLAGVGLLVAGVVWALRVRPVPVPAH